MTARFNPPPHWPPPAGWTPAPDSQPVPGRGPAPHGWQFGVDLTAPGGYGARPLRVPGAPPYPGASRRPQGFPGTTSSAQTAGQPPPHRDAWQRAGDMALGLFAVFGILAALLVPGNPAYAAGWVFGTVLLPVYLVMLLLSALGAQS